MLKKATRLHQKQRFSGAAKLYQSVLKSEPKNVDALHFYGLLHHHRGESQKAAEMILAAIGINPDYADAYLNLGNIYLSVADLTSAQKCYEKALELSPTNIGVATNLGILHKYKGDLDKSEAYLEAVVKSSPNLSASYINLANTQFVMKKGDEAIANYHHAITLAPEDTAVYSIAVKSCNYLKQPDKAFEFLKLWQKIDKNHPGVKHLSAAMSGTDVPKRASDAYVETTFDAYADRFESSLARLEYCGPALLGESLKKIYPNNTTGLNILDAGCGTGLAHEHLKPYAKKLVGMDLSSKMLEKARTKKSYDQLICSSLEKGINKYEAYFDLIACMDTFVYFGDLNLVFKRIHKALASGGRFVFTTERFDADGDYQLCHHGRYVHAKEYLKTELARCDFKILEINTCVTRKEFGEDVNGWLVMAHK